MGNKENGYEQDGSIGRHAGSSENSSGTLLGPAVDG